MFRFQRGADRHSWNRNIGLKNHSITEFGPRPKTSVTNRSTLKRYLFIVIYDQIPAGIGFSERLFELHDELLARALELVSACECDAERGCPSCVGPGGENGYGGKKEARALLEALVEQ